MDFDSLLVALNRQSTAELRIINAKVRELLAGHGVQAEREPGHCARCGKILTGQRRRSRKYCGDVCRQQAHRSRKAPAAPAAELRIITARQARPFVERWHYSKNVPGGKNVFFGWFANGRLYAVANYGIGVSMNHDTTLAKLTGEPVTRENLFELKRLCRVEPAKAGMPLTKFLAGCHRILKREHGIRFVVSFSDPEH